MHLLHGVVLLSVLIGVGPRTAASQAAQAPAATAVLFRNVRIFDGRRSALSPPSNVLVRGTTIAAISAAPIAVDSSGAMVIIDGRGRTLMPGLIDAHVHVMFAAVPQLAALTADIGYVELVAAREAERMLMRGFTSVRDMGGPAFGLKRAIDEGLVIGPRIYPSGAFITQTSGHGDFRLPTDVPRDPTAPLTYTERVGAAAIADGADQVLLRTREQLMRGASQIKLMAGGGVASPYDPIDVTQYSEAEMRAAVGAAEDWGTYVAVHAYTSRAIRRAIAAGVKCIEHGQLADAATARLMAESGVWWSLQPFVDDEDANPQPDPAKRGKQLEVFAGTDSAYGFAKRYRIKTAWGTDILFDPRRTDRQSGMLVKMTRWYTPAEVLRMATADNAALLALSGPRNPYPGRLGVVETGALADLLLVDGDPIAELGVLQDPGRRLVVIMKGGRIYKDTSH